MNQRLYFDDGQARKHWSIAQRGRKVTTRFGRVGTNGREVVKELDSPKAAREEAAKQLAAKERAGYVHVNPSLLNLKRPPGVRKATESQVAKFEAEIGYELPAEYREFLLTQNGGRLPEDHPTNRYMCVDMRAVEGFDNVGVGQLLSLSNKAPHYASLRIIAEYNMPLLPPGHLPISLDSDIFTISLDKKRGRIFWWNHDHPDFSWEDEDEEGRVHYRPEYGFLYAHSFDEFLTRIARFDETVY